MMKFLLFAAFLAVARSLEEDATLARLNADAIVKPEAVVSADGTTAANCTKKMDPRHWSICYPYPPWARPDPNIWSLQGVTYQTNSWWYRAFKTTMKAAEGGDRAAKSTLAAMPKNYQLYARRYTTNNLDEMARKPVPGQPRPDWREWYWQLSCPYTRNWLLSFYHRWYKRCWILWPFFPRVTYARCTIDHCRTRCHYLFPGDRISKCFETHYKTYYRYVFCPYIYSHYRINFCLSRPWFCFRKIRFRVPQCCDCYHCRYSGINSVFAAATKVEEKSAAEGETEMEVGEFEEP